MEALMQPELVPPRPLRDQPVVPLENRDLKPTLPQHNGEMATVPSTADNPDSDLVFDVADHSPPVSNRHGRARRGQRI